MDHPVTRVVGHELDVSSLCHSHQDRVTWSPERHRHPASLSTRYSKCVSMKVDRVVIHSQVDKPDPNSASETHHQGSGHRAGYAVESQPVELHIGAVGNSAARKKGPFLHDDPEVVVDSGLQGHLRMHNEHPDHAHHFLHGPVRVIEEGAVLV